MRIADFIAIMAVFLLVAVAIVPRIVGHSCTACVSKSIADIAFVKRALDQFEFDCGRYPSSREGLNALLDSPRNVQEHWKGLYHDSSLATDFWGRPYLYESDGRTYSVTSLGADGKRGGEGEDADLMECD